MSEATSPARIGFVGFGIMGQSMAGHLLAAGHPLRVYNRSADKARALVGRGAVWCDTPGAVAAGSDVVITMVGYPRDVEEVWLGAEGVLTRARGALLIDMTTSSPELAQRLAREAAARGCRALDAPVSGGDLGAREARLSIMVGGDTEAFAQALPVLQRMGKTIVHTGGAGTGQHTKMCNQLVIASTIMGVCEGLAYARSAGLDPDLVLQCISGGAAGSFQLSVMGPKIVEGDLAPGFMIEHFLKDLSIALAEADRLGLQLPGAEQARKLYAQLVDQGHAREGTQALSRLYGARA
ncbi:NAD(P)-dependent oxidoreductase [Ramlibacter alkalitolerans]|uniref:NAD(P)-dependent oxidoreductase n=1 Tax=Ramlibacter alkalitolerans TaxID=2039631 RepID=A0ABS1JM01_9BURK|nr:NAD(P)-dependent oxidoreductase [Ramlibacter alkalitolerans]MBL0425242.1 NAD(P)-dependent oxidoreductase [Ramlibacter alkalitolerans]